jgi:hypothetical protein
MRIAGMSHGVRNPPCPVEKKTPFGAGLGCSGRVASIKSSAGHLI